jgi:ribosomal protein S21
VLDRRRQAGTRIVLEQQGDLETALRLFREDTLMAKREARRKRHFLTPGERRKLKAINARKRLARARKRVKR